MSKRWLIALAVIVLSPVAALILALRSESTVLRGLEWAVDSLTEFDLELVNPRIDVYAGYASADEVHLHQDTSLGPAIISVLDLQASDLRWRDLLRQTLKSGSLSASSVLIYISKSDDTRDPEPITWLRYLSWLPNRADIGIAHLITRDRNVWIFPMKDISGYRGDYDNFIAEGKADSDGEPLTLVVELHALRENDAFFGVELSAELDATDSGGHGTLNGEIKGTSADYEYDFQLSANYPSVQEFFETYQGVGQRLRGSLTLEGRLRGNGDSMTLEAQRIVLDNMPAYGIEASGTLTRELDAPGVAIDVVSAGEISSLAPLGTLFSADLSNFGRAQASAYITGTLSRPEISEFILATRSPSGLAVNASGRISSAELAAGDTRADNEIMVDVSGPNLQRLEPWIGEIALDPGPWSASAVVTGTRDRLTLKNVLLEAGTAGVMDFRVAGTVDEIDLTSSPFTPAQITGIDATFSAKAEDSGDLGALLNLAVPAYHTVDAYLEVRGAGDDFTGSNGYIKANNSDLELAVTDISLRRLRKKSFEIGEFNGKLSGTLSDTSALSQYTEQPVISLGPMTFSAELTQTGPVFAAENIIVDIAGEGMSLNSTGSVADLQRLSGVSLRQRFSGLDTHALLATILEDFSYPHQLGQLAGSFGLRGDAGEFRINELTATNMGSERLSFGLKGDINDLSRLGADLWFQAKATDTALLKALSGLQMAETDVAGTLRSQHGVVQLDGSMKIGETTLSTDTAFSLEDGKLQSLDTQITAPRLNLDDLGLQAEGSGADDYRPADQFEKAAENSFDRMLSRAPRFPSRIRLSIEEISGENSAIDSLELELTGDDGAYTVRQLDVAYVTGQAQVRGIVDLSQQPIAISLAGQAISIPMNRLSQDVGLDMDVQGTLSFLGGLTGRGSDKDELLQSLEGSLAFALENATIEGAAYDVLATGILEWMYSGAVLEASTTLDCTMARFVFDRGQAITDNIFIETRKMIATGEATLDLAASEIDLSLTPRSKSRAVQIPSTVRVRGPFDNPRTIVSPISAAADASAEALVLIPSLAMKLFGIKRDEKNKQRPCEAVIN